MEEDPSVKRDKALSASVKGNASVDSSPKMSLIACTAASHPPALPAQSYKFPAELMISGLMTERMQGCCLRKCYGSPSGS